MPRERAAELVLDSVGQVRALAHPLRQQVLRLVTDQALTNKEISDLLGERPGRVHFHVRTLLGAGLVEEVEQRQRGGVVEKLYQAVAAGFRLGPEVGAASLEGERLVRALLDAAGEEYARAVDYFGGRPAGTLVGQEHAWLSPARRARIERQLRAVEQELQAAQSDQEATQDATRMALTLLLHPLPPKPS